MTHDDPGRLLAEAVKQFAEDERLRLLAEDTEPEDEETAAFVQAVRKGAGLLEDGE